MSPRWLLLVPLLLAWGYAQLTSYHQLGSATPFDESPPASVEEATERLATFGEARVFYREFLVEDARFILANLLAFALLIRVASERVIRARVGRVSLLMLPLAMAAADVVENVAIWQLLGDFPTPGAGWVRVAQVATPIKFGALGATAISVVGLYVAWSVKRLRA